MPGERNLQYFVETLPALEGQVSQDTLPVGLPSLRLVPNSEDFRSVAKCLCFSASCGSVRKPHLSLAFCFFSSASFRFAAFSSLTCRGPRPNGHNDNHVATTSQPLLLVSNPCFLWRFWRKIIPYSFRAWHDECSKGKQSHAYEYVCESWEYHLTQSHKSNALAQHTPVYSIWCKHCSYLPSLRALSYFVGGQIEGKVQDAIEGTGRGSKWKQAFKIFQNSPEGLAIFFRRSSMFTSVDILRLATGFCCCQKAGPIGTGRLARGHRAPCGAILCQGLTALETLICRMSGPFHWFSKAAVKARQRDKHPKYTHAVIAGQVSKTGSMVFNIVHHTCIYIYVYLYMYMYMYLYM